MVLVLRQGDSTQLIAPTRHDPDAAFLRVVPLADPSARRLRKAFSGEDGFDIGTDNRGVQIIAAWRNLTNLNFTMEVKIDAAEVFEPVIHERNWSILIGSLTVLPVAWLAVRGAVSVAGPLARLAGAARRMARGELEQRVTGDGPGEVSDLATSFNSEMDGFELLRRLQEFSALQRPRVVMLSSADHGGYAAQARQPRAADYLLKPVKPLQFLDAITSVLGIESAPPCPHRSGRRSAGNPWIANTGRLRQPGRSTAGCAHLGISSTLCAGGQ